MKTYEIIPNNGRKSFYGKAIAREYNGNAILTSYTTEVARIDKEGRFSRLWGGYSVTTMNHINAFRAMFGLPTMTNKPLQGILLKSMVSRSKRTAQE